MAFATSYCSMAFYKIIIIIKSPHEWYKKGQILMINSTHTLSSPPLGACKERSQTNMAHDCFPRPLLDCLPPSPTMRRWDEKMIHKIQRVCCLKSESENQYDPQHQSVRIQSLLHCSMDTIIQNISLENMQRCADFHLRDDYLSRLNNSLWMLTVDSPAFLVKYAYRGKSIRKPSTYD